MPKCFSYQTGADLLAAARELRVADAIHADSDLSCLLQPVVIGGRKIGNRLALHPMEGCDGELDGRPGELTFRRWQRFGRGGCKLVWGEAVAILDDARANSRQLWIHDGSLHELGRLLKNLKSEHRAAWGPNACDDLLVGCQLTHSGRYSFRRPLIAMHDPALDPLTLMPGPDGTKIPMPPDYPLLSDDELKRAEDAYVHAAKLAVKLGFDFLDLKQCHRYLLNEMLASHTRPGPYGGSFENRTRLIRNIVARIRDQAGKSILLASRINVCDFVPYMKGADGVGAPRPYTTPYKWSFGVNENAPETPDLTEPRQLVALLSGLGVSLFNLSMGNPYNNMHYLRPFEKPPLDGYASPEHPLQGVARHFTLAGEMQRAFPDVPMIGSGYSWLQHLFLECGAANIKRGAISLVGVGRGAFAYPDFVKDIHETGKIKPEKACIAVSSCTALMRAKGNEYGQYPTGCVPKDKFYGPIYREAINNYKAGNQPKK